METNLSINDFIVDSELIAYDTETNKILPFQNLTQRSRKYVNDKDLRTQVAMQAFDLIYLNGKSLLNNTFEERRETLRTRFKEIQGQFMFAHGIDTNDTNELEIFLE